MLRHLTHRTMYVLSEKRIDDSLQVLLVTRDKMIGRLSLHARAISAEATRSGTRTFLHAVEVPRWIPYSEVARHAAPLIAPKEPGSSAWLLQCGVVIIDRGVTLVVDAY